MEQLHGGVSHLMKMSTPQQPNFEEGGFDIDMMQYAAPV